jgi:uncharacterized repeat protein (TIGR01451 family)/fimbrial isopeptide formation D2 family protein
LSRHFERTSNVSARFLEFRAALASSLVAVLLIALGVVGLPLSSAQAASSPSITMSSNAPTSVLLAGQAGYSLTVHNPTGQVAGFNVSFRDVLAAGVSYVAGSTSPTDAGEPTIVANKPSAGQTTLIWRNVGDVQAGGDLTLGFKATPDSTLLPVGSTFTNAADSYVSSNPRQVAAFDATGAVVAASYTASASSAAQVTAVSAIEIRKSEPSPEHELVRGVHNNSTIYQLTVTNNYKNVTNGVTVTDLLPAGLEFLGCGDVDYTTTGTVEYPGAPRLDAVPDLTTTSCPQASTVDTVTNPPGHPGVYTQVVWNVGNLAIAEVRTIAYRAGIPLRANTATFSGSTPSPGSLHQAANLDNNTGASTAETGTEQAFANHAQAAGNYQGPVYGGGSTVVTASDDLTVTSEDLAMQKSVAPTAFKGGDIATYTLRLETGEYRDTSDIVITDHIPNGVCPVSNTANYAIGSPGECDPGTAGNSATDFDPTNATIASATQNPDGSFDLVFDAVPSLVHNGVLTITYQGRMRRTYTGPGGGVTTGSPTVAGDSFTNTVSLDGTSQAFGTNPPDNAGNVTVHDASSAGQSSGGPSIDKTIQARAASTDCSTGAYIDTPTPASRPAFHLGDRVCFQLRVDFPASNPTRNAVVTDFLPVGTTYEAVSATTGPGNTVPGGQISFNEAATVAGTADPTWTLGLADVNGVRFVATGQVLVVRLSAIIGAPAAGATPDIVGNLMKLRSENSPGHAVSLRDQVDLQVTPAPPLLVQKGVESVNGVPATPRPANFDTATAHQGDAVIFRIDITNQGSVANSNNQTVRALRLLDALPTGVTCAAITIISDSGSCFDSATTGRPSVNPTTASVLLWALPQSDSIAALAVRPALTYTMTIPSVVSVSTVLTNTAGVSQYDADTDIVVGGVTSTTTYHPKTNIDTSVPSLQQNAPAASDTSKVTLPNVVVTKSGTTDINETNNSLASQAVVGEPVTYTLTARVPAQTTVFNAIFSDPMPTGLTFVSASATFTPDAAVPTVLGAMPLGVAQNTTTTGSLTFPATYTNSTTVDQLFTVTILAKVSTLAGNIQGTVRTNTASFNSTTLLTAGSAIAARTASYGVTVVAPSPTLAKSDDTTGKIVTAGQVVTFTLTAGNAAGPAAKDTVVVDCVPAGLSFNTYGLPTQGGTSAAVAGDVTNGCAIGTTRLQWDVGALAAPLAASQTLTYTATVDPASAGQTAYANSALLTGSTLADGINDASPTTTERVSTATATDTLTVDGAAITKTATPTLPTVGERVTYTVTASIPANVNLYDAALIDALPAGIDETSVLRTAFTCVSSAVDCLPSIPVGGGTLTNAVVGSTTLQGWLLGDVLSFAQVRTVTATYTAVVKVALPTNTRGVTLTNTATIRWNSSNGSDPTSAGATFVRTSSGALATVTVQEPLLSVAKAVNDTTPELGQIFTYTITVSNSAAANVSAAFNTVVVDLVPVGVVVDTSTISAGGTYDGLTRTITWTIPGPIAKGASLTRNYQAALGASPTLTAAAKTNTVTVQSYASLPLAGRTYAGPSATANVTPAFPSITPTKTSVTAGQAFVGESFTWQLTLTNPSLSANPAKAFGVDALDTLPPNWTYDTGSARVRVAGGLSTQVEPTTITSSGGVQTLTWTNLGSLDAGQTVVVTYTATPALAAATTSPGAGLSVAHTNGVSTTWEDATAATGSSSGLYSAGPAIAAAHIASADLIVSKSHTGSFTAGGTGTWDVVVRNAGTDTASGPFVLTDPLPAGTTLVSAGGTGWDCAGTSTVTCSRSVASDSLAAPASFPVVKVVVDVAPDVAAGSSLTNSATATALTFDPSLANNTATDSAAVVASADLWVTKTHPVGLRAVAGAPFTWTVAVTNLGPSVARGPITMTDTLPAGTTYVSASGDGWTCAAVGQLVTCASDPDLGLNEVAAAILVKADVSAGTTGMLGNIARVSGTTPDPVPVNNNATDVVAVDTAADLMLAKDHVGAFVAGRTGTYRFRVDNRGPSDAARPVTITDALPNGLTATGVKSDVSGSWTCNASGSLVCTLAGALAAGDFAIVDVQVLIPPSATGHVVNTASVSSNTTDPNPVNNSNGDDSALTGVADLSIIKSHTADPVAGEDLVFTLAVHNAGPSNTPGTPGTVRVSDGLPAGMTFVSATGTGWDCSSTAPVALLAPLASPAPAAPVVTCDLAAGIVSGRDAQPITLTVHIDQGAGPATLANTATVQGPLSDPDLTNNNSTDTIDVTDNANVALSKTITSPTSPTAVRAGEDITYNLHVTNYGPSTADTLVVTDSMPSGSTLVSASADPADPGWTCAPGPDVRCSRDTLAVGSSDITVVVRVDSTVPADTSITNTAQVDTSTPGDVLDDNFGSATINVAAGADLGLVKTHRGGPATAGRTVTFDLVVSNAGPSAAQHPLTVTDRLPAGLTFASAGAGWTCTAAAVTPAGQIVSCDLDGTTPLDASNDAQTLTIVAQVASDLTPDTIINTADVHSTTTDPYPTNNNATDAVDVVGLADIIVTKSHTGAFTAGGTGTWDVVVRNAGPSAAAGIVLTDTLPAGTTLVSAAGAGWTCTVAPVTCTRSDAADTLAASASFPVVNVVVHVAPDVAAGSSLTNSATAKSVTVDPVLANNTDTDDALVVASADLLVTKTHPAIQRAVAGAPFTWTVAVTNLGPSVSRAPITVADTLPAGTTYVSATGDGWTCAAAALLVTCASAADLALGEVSAQIAVTANVTSGATGTLSNAAHVSGTTPDPASSNNDATDTVGVDTTADLMLTKNHIGAFVAGSAGTYRFRVDNLGPSDAAGPVTITDTLPDGLTATDLKTDLRGSWTCNEGGSLVCTLAGVLAAGDFATVEVQVQIPSSATGNITNNATVTSSTTDPNPVNNSDGDDSALDGVADLSIIKSHTADPVAGVDLAFTLAVHNAGPSDTPKTPGTVRVSDGLPTGMTFVSAIGTGWDCSSTANVVTCDLAAGIVSGHDVAPITLTVHIDQGAGPATLANIATVQGPLNDPAPENNSDTDTLIVLDDANVALTKTITSPTGTVRAGEDITYNLHVTNDGPSSADTLVVADPMPAGTTLVSATADPADPGWTCAPGPDVRCSRPTLAVGSSDITVVLRVDSTVLDGTSITNTAQVDTSTRGDVPGDNVGSATINVEAGADLRLVKTHEGPATAGRTVIFDLAVHNAGPSAAQHPLTVKDVLPAGLTFASGGAGWTCTPAEVTAAGQSITCDLDGATPVDAGNDAKTLTIVAQVAPDLKPGTVVNTADVHSATTDPDPGNNDATDAVDVNAAVGLSVTKTHTGLVRIGHQLTFAFVVRNAGPSTASNVVLTDIAPIGLTPSSSHVSPGWTCTGVGRQVTCRLARTLGVGATAPPLSLTYLVGTAAFPRVDNRAGVTSDGTESNPADNVSVDPVSVPPLVDLKVRKSLEGALAVGSEATYVVEIGNAGPTNDTGPITMTDTLPAGLAYVAATGDGWSCIAAGRAVTCTRAAGLTVGASTKVRLRVNVLPAAYPSVSNRASVSSPSDDSDPANNTDTYSGIVVGLVDLAVAKRLTASVDGRATWTISVDNRGPNAADRPFTVVDQLPSGLDYVAAGGAGWTCGLAGKRLTCTYGQPLGVGATAAVTVVTRVTASPGTTLTNGAVVASSQDWNPANNTARADLNVTAKVQGIGAPRGWSGLPRTGADFARLLALSLLLMLAGFGTLRIMRRPVRQK